MNDNSLHALENASSFGVVGSSKESRAMEAMRVKDEQYKTLSDHNMKLLQELNQMEDNRKSLELSKLSLEEENNTLREKNFEMQAKVSAADASLRKSENELEDKGKQHKIMTDHNGELLRLLEKLEFDKASLERDHSVVKENITSLEGKYASLLATAKTHEGMASQASAASQLRAEEVRILRAENDQIRNTNVELKMKSQVEVESLQDQLRISKEKHYQLLQKLQSNDEARQQALDQVSGMEEKLRTLHEKKVELETQVQVESRAKRSQIDANKELTIQVDNYARSNASLTSKMNASEAERIRIEAESRDTSEQLTQMSEKVFQLLERMKLAEGGKTKAIDSLKRKEQEMVALKKKNSRMLDEASKAGKARTKAELDKKVASDQIIALKKHNSQLNNRICEEVKLKLKADEDNKKLQDKAKVMGGRLSFLLSSSKSNEEYKIVQKEEMKKMQAQLLTKEEHVRELSTKLNALGESNRVLTQAMRLKQSELEETTIKFNALTQKFAAKVEEFENNNHRSSNHSVMPATNQEDQRKERGYYYVECSKASQGIMTLRPKHAANKKGAAFLEKYHITPFLKRAQRSSNIKQALIEKIGHLLSELLDSADNTTSVEQSLTASKDSITHLSHKVSFAQEKAASEEDAKRRILLRYVDACKKISTSDTDVIPSLQLPESGIGDEEVHAIAACLRGNKVISRLVLKNNSVTDEGARALAAVLSSPNVLSYVDLRGNCIGESGVRVLSEALERNSRIKHVFVHGEGKIEGMGQSTTAASSSSATIETQCTVDVRENEGRKVTPANRKTTTPPVMRNVTPKVVPIAKNNAAMLEKRKEEVRKRQEKKRVEKVKEQRWDKGSNLPSIKTTDASSSVGYAQRLVDSPLK